MALPATLPLPAVLPSFGIEIHQYGGDYLSMVYGKPLGGPHTTLYRIDTGDSLGRPRLTVWNGTAWVWSGAVYLDVSSTAAAHAANHLGGGIDPFVPLPIGEYTLTASQTIGATQKAVLWGTLTISLGATLTVNGKLLIMNEPYGV